MTGTMNPIEEQPAAALDAALAPLGSRCRHLVAYSGGPDSTLLLALLAERLPHRRLLGIHVHHGWHPDADTWALHCRETAARLSIRCLVERVDARPVAGEGPEAAARNARYAALAAAMGPGDVLWTAHHADDQAETLLLALLRGGGIRGVAGMPARRQFAGGTHLRPWLAVTRQQLLEAHAHRDLPALHDPANENPALDRVHIRQSVLPALQTRWPHAAATLARAAGRFACDMQLLDDLAARDLTGCRGRVDGTLDRDALLRLPVARQGNLVRNWLSRLGLPRPPAPRLSTLLAQVATARSDRNPCIRWPGAEARCWQGLLWALPELPAIDPAAVYIWSNPAEPLPLADRTVRPFDPEALGIQLGEPARVEVVYRQGGERIRPPGATRSRALGRHLVERGVPPWERDRLPLIRVNGEIVATAPPRWALRQS